VGLFNFLFGNRSDNVLRDVARKTDHYLRGKKLANEGLSHRAIGNYDKALELFSQAIKQYTYLPAVSLVATTLIKQDRLDGAEKWIHTCLKHYQERTDFVGVKVELLANLGVIYVRTKRFAEALAAYETALGIGCPEDISPEVFDVMRSGIYRDLAFLYACLSEEERVAHGNDGRDLTECGRAIEYMKQSYEYCVRRLAVQPDCEHCLELKNNMDSIFKTMLNRWLSRAEGDNRP
jgi:tetratricopeptide (TPR) repeat protein